MPIMSLARPGLEVSIEHLGNGTIEVRDTEWFNVTVKNPFDYRVVDITLYVELTKADGSKTTKNFLIPSNMSVNYINAGGSWVSSLQLRVGDDDGQHCLNATVYYDVERVESNASRGKLDLKITKD